jgi:hypothetical protein
VRRLILPAGLIVAFLATAAGAVPTKPHRPAKAHPGTVAIAPRVEVAPEAVAPPPPVAAPPAARRGPLTADELAMARAAWMYFEKAYHPESGLSDAVAGYPSTTMWDTASYLAAIVSAYELEIIDRHTFDDRIVRLTTGLNQLQLFRDELPNKAYNSKTLEKVNYRNAPGEIGWSAIDIGRMLIWLRILRDRYPEHANAVDHIVMRWKFCHVLDERGELYGAVVADAPPPPAARPAGAVPPPIPALVVPPVVAPASVAARNAPLPAVTYLQEGRLGYEEYAAKGFQLWGFHTELASLPDPWSSTKIFGVDVPYDTRDPRTQYAHSYVVTESYALDGMELDWNGVADCDPASHHSDAVTADFAQRIYDVQSARYCRTGVITARSEHQLDRAPYFVYDSIFSDGFAWNTITDKGAFLPDAAAVSTKAALGMWALWPTRYTDLLYRTVSNLYDPEKGFYEGTYENGTGPVRVFTANNNGIVLETLLFKVQGPIAPRGREDGLWESTLRDRFNDNASFCRPKCPLVPCARKTCEASCQVVAAPAPCAAVVSPCAPASACGAASETVAPHR